MSRFERLSAFLADYPRANRVDTSENSAFFRGDGGGIDRYTYNIDRLRKCCEVIDKIKDVDRTYKSRWGKVPDPPRGLSHGDIVVLCLTANNYSFSHLSFEWLNANDQHFISLWLIIKLSLEMPTIGDSLSVFMRSRDGNKYREHWQRTLNMSSTAEVYLSLSDYLEENGMRSIRSTPKINRRNEEGRYVSPVFEDRGEVIVFERLADALIEMCNL